MSTYVDALERWSGEAQPAAEAAAAVAPGDAAHGHLRDRLEAGGAPAGMRIAFVGVIGRERGSDVAAGYAEFLAQGGRRVLFVDLAPSQTDTSTATGAPPLEAQVLAGAKLEPPQRPGVLRVVSEPRFEGRPRDFEAKLRAWLDEQRPQFDRLVLHAGAALRDASASSIASWADATALVARAGWTARADLGDAGEALRRAGAHLALAVLCGARRLPPAVERALAAVRLR
jgi:Mrp family chromosome partitioning ATPase